MRLFRGAAVRVDVLFDCSTVPGLAISGASSDDVRQQLADSVRRVGRGPSTTFAFPDSLYEHIFVCDDVLPSLRTVLPTGISGMLLISGTGSNCLYHHHQYHEEEEQLGDIPRVKQCGGGGHFLGDEGSAWDIATSTMTKAFAILEGRQDLDDGRWTDVQAVQSTRAAIFHHFGLGVPQSSDADGAARDVRECRKRDLYPLLYGARAKTKKEVAALTRELARLASDGDEFCRHQVRGGGACSHAYGWKSLLM